MKRREFLIKSTFAAALLAAPGCAFPAFSETSVDGTWGTQPLGPDVPPLQWKPAQIKRPLQSRFKSFPVSGEKIILAQNGRPLASIVLPVDAGSSCKAAAIILQDILQQISGVQLPVISEAKLDADAKSTLISLGETALAKKAGMDAKDLLADGYRLKTQGKVLFIAGNDNGSGMEANGTRNAVYALLERHFGCRWLWPGELGEALPRQSDLAINPLHEQDEPALPVRGMRNSYLVRNGKLNHIYITGLLRLNRSGASFIEKAKDSQEWLDAIELGQSVHYSYGHGFNDWWEKYGKTHPEYFALQPDGTRNQVKAGPQYADRARLDVSNPDLIKAVAANAIATFRADPNRASISISPNDGGPPGFCMCENCRRLDPPNAPAITANFGEGHRRDKYVSLSDRYVTFYAKVAEIVRKEFPDKILGSYAYSAYRTPPLYAQLPPNVLVGFVGLNYFSEKQRQTNLQDWDGWTRAATHLLLRPNALIAGHGFPGIYAHKLGDDIKHCYQTGMMATDFDSIMHNWAGQGLNYYVLAKLLWDPSLDVDDIIRDYCSNGFGVAAPAVQKYFSRLEKLTNEIADDPGDVENEEDALSGSAFNSLLSLLSRHYTDEKLNQLQTLLDNAKTQAGNDATVVRRIEFLEQGIRYARAEVAPVRLFIRMRTDSKTRTAANQQKMLELLENRQQVFQDIYDRYFYAQNVIYPIFRETSMWRDYGWNPGNEK
jgi:hypothetical protein